MTTCSQFIQGCQDFCRFVPQIKDGCIHNSPENVFLTPGILQYQELSVPFESTAAEHRFERDHNLPGDWLNYAKSSSLLVPKLQLGNAIAVKAPALGSLQRSFLYHLGSKAGAWELDDLPSDGDGRKTYHCIT
jgi:hypothetical protein